MLFLFLAQSKRRGPFEKVTLVHYAINLHNFLHLHFVVTARKQSCGKGMFLHVYVCPFGQWYVSSDGHQVSLVEMGCPSDGSGYVQGWGGVSMSREGVPSTCG